MALRGHFLLVINNRNSLRISLMDIDESAVLDFAQRRKRAITLRKFSSKIKMARKRAQLRKASNEKLMERSRRAAIKVVRKIVAGKMGLDYNTAPISQRMMIDKRVQQRSAIIPKIAQRLLPKIRKLEMERLQSRTSVKESDSYDDNDTDVVAVEEPKIKGSVNWRMRPIKRNALEKARRIGDESDDPDSP